MDHKQIIESLTKLTEELKQVVSNFWKTKDPERRTVLYVYCTRKDRTSACNLDRLHKSIRQTQFNVRTRRHNLNIGSDQERSSMQPKKGSIQEAKHKRWCMGSEPWWSIRWCSKEEVGWPISDILGKNQHISDIFGTNQPSSGALDTNQINTGPGQQKFGLNASQFWSASITKSKAKSPYCTRVNPQLSSKQRAQFKVARLIFEMLS